MYPHCISLRYHKCLHIILIMMPFFYLILECYAKYLPLTLSASTNVLSAPLKTPNLKILRPQYKYKIPKQKKKQKNMDTVIQVPKVQGGK